MQILVWAGFLLFILLMLAIDLGVFHKEAHVVTIREALTWVCVWVSLSLVFNVLIYFLYTHHWLGFGQTVGHDVSGREAALMFFTGYIIEYSLSMDNIFVIALIFAYFRVPDIHQHRVLFWGILGAVVMRGIMIGLGTALIQRFEWIIYIFGALLIATAVKMMLAGTEQPHPDKNPLVRLARKLYPVTSDFVGKHFFVIEKGRRAMTPLFITLIVVENTDLLFAVDSIPAIFAITTDPFLVFTSNVFAILGLRSLYFALAGLMDKFRDLKSSLVFILAFVGVKMLLTHLYEIPTLFSLAVVAGILVVGIGASLLAARREEKSARYPME
ncbi:MAG: TerC family protein [bacterium]